MKSLFVIIMKNTAILTFLVLSTSMTACSYRLDTKEVKNVLLVQEHGINDNNIIAIIEDTNADTIKMHSIINGEYTPEQGEESVINFINEQQANGVSAISHLYNPGPNETSLYFKEIFHNQYPGMDISGCANRISANNYAYILTDGSELIMKGVLERIKVSIDDPNIVAHSLPPYLSENAMGNTLSIIFKVNFEINMPQ